MAKKKDNSALGKLSDKRRVFVLAYLANGFNAAKAARQAGYAQGSAMQQGSRLLSFDDVAAAVKEQLYERGITPERVTVAIAEIAFGTDAADFEKFFKGTSLSKLREAGVNTALVKSARVTPNQFGTSRTLELHDRLGALKELVRVLGLVTERQVINGSMRVRQELDLTSLSRETKRKVLAELGGPTE